MRIWILKLTGFVLWGLFLFAPFIARAGDGFDTVVLQDAAGAQAKSDALFSLGGYELRLDKGAPFSIPLEEKWSVKFNAGRDTVLPQGAQAERIARDRMPIDDRGRRGLRFGVGLRYSL